MIAQKTILQRPGGITPNKGQLTGTSLLLTAFALTAFFLVGCVGDPTDAIGQQGEPAYSTYVPVENNGGLQATSAPSSGTRLTLIKFRGNSECVSCVNLGKFANSTLGKNFRKELSAGAVKYLDINAEADFANPYVQKYRPTHASLYLLSESANGEKYEELTEAWYYTGDEARYSQYLTGVLRNRLGG